MSSPNHHPHYALMEKAIAFLCKHFQDQPSLAEAARYIGFSEYHFQRVFQDWVGVSPKQFLQYLTADYVRQRLQACQNTLLVSDEAGLSSSSRLHDLTIKIYAATPAEIKSQGANLILRYGLHDTPFGICGIVLSERGICHLSFLDNADPDTQLRTELNNEWPSASIQSAREVTVSIAECLFTSGLRPEELKVHLKGSPFQLKVWEALLKIPPGQVVTYQAIARHIGKPQAYRAAATAIGKNPIAYLIPCHRVIRQSGIIGDYRWRTDRKKMLLGWEAVKRAEHEHAGKRD